MFAVRLGFPGEGSLGGCEDACLRGGAPLMVFPRLARGHGPSIADTGGHYGAVTMDV